MSAGRPSCRSTAARWVIGSKNEQGIPLLNHLAHNGWVGFNVNYQLSPRVKAPDHLIDCKRALAWIREHADEYGVDPDFIVVTGGSAGGHLCALMALTANDPEYQPGFDDADTSLVQAAVPFYGVYDMLDRDSHQLDTLREVPPARGDGHGTARGRRGRGRPTRRSTASPPTLRRCSSSTATRTSWSRSREPGAFAASLAEASTQPGHLRRTPGCPARLRDLPEHPLGADHRVRRALPAPCARQYLATRAADDQIVDRRSIEGDDRRIHGDRRVLTGVGSDPGAPPFVGGIPVETPGGSLVSPDRPTPRPATSNRPRTRCRRDPCCTATGSRRGRTRRPRRPWRGSGPEIDEGGERVDLPGQVVQTGNLTLGPGGARQTPPP